MSKTWEGTGTVDFVFLALSPTSSDYYNKNVPNTNSKLNLMESKQEVSRRSFKGTSWPQANLSMAHLKYTRQFLKRFFQQVYLIFLGWDENPTSVNFETQEFLYEMKFDFAFLSAAHKKVFLDRRRKLSGETNS